MNSWGMKKTEKMANINRVHRGGIRTISKGSWRSGISDTRYRLQYFVEQMRFS